jgi:hypothetical protein
MKPCEHSMLGGKTVLFTQTIAINGALRDHEIEIK